MSRFGSEPTTRRTARAVLGLENRWPRWRDPNVSCSRDTARTADRDYDEFAVEVPGMSWPQIGFDDTGTKPFFSACITHEH
jgi:hypothetical protein